MKSSVSLLLVITTAFASNAIAQAPHSSAPGADQHAIYRPSEIKWQDGPPSLPPGAKLAVLEGDPAKEGPFTMRIKVPDGYKIMPHVHPATEHVTVLSGSLNFGMGEKFDQSATKEMSTGAFGYWPAGMTHFVWIKGETILQVHGVGPWGIKYVNPVDDPRNAKGKK
jgi:quercetin dioxygenase-like cupin family protein